MAVALKSVGTPHKRARIVDIELDDEYVMQLAEMGVRIGSEIEIIRNQPREPIIISVMSSRIILSRDLAKYIRLE